MPRDDFAATNPLAPARADQLPDEAWVQLTQGVTWILTGRARTDEEIQQDKAESARIWGSEAGPGWLKPCLEHIRSAQDPLPAIETDGYLPLDPLAADGVPRLIAKAQRWLQECGYAPDAADARVCAEIDRLALEDARRERLYKLIFSGRYELMGILHQPNPHRRHIPPVPIPTFELRRVSHTMGHGCHGMGELGPTPATSMKVFFNTTLFGTKAQDDRRPAYLEVIIKRTDVLALKGELELSEGQCQGSAETSRLNGATAACKTQEPEGNQRQSATSILKSPYAPEIQRAALKRFEGGIPRDYGASRIKRYLDPILQDTEGVNLPPAGINAKTYSRALKNFPRK